MRYSNFSQVQFAVQCCCMLLCQRTDSLTAPPLVSWFAAHRAHAGLYVPAKGLSSLTCFPSSFSSSEHKNSSVHPGFLRLQKLTQNQANAALFGGACDDWLFIYSPKFSPGLGYDSWRDVITTRFQRSSVHVHRTSKVLVYQQTSRAIAVSPMRVVFWKDQNSQVALQILKRAATKLSVFGRNNQTPRNSYIHEKCSVCHDLSWCCQLYCNCFNVTDCCVMRTLRLSNQISGSELTVV